MNNIHSQGTLESASLSRTLLYSLFPTNYKSLTGHTSSIWRHRQTTLLLLVENTNLERFHFQRYSPWMSPLTPVSAMREFPKCKKKKKKSVVSVIFATDLCYYQMLCNYNSWIPVDAATTVALPVPANMTGTIFQVLSPEYPESISEMRSSFTITITPKQ